MNNRAPDIGVETGYKRGAEEAALGTIMSRLVRIEKVSSFISSKVTMLDKKLAHVLSSIPLKGSAGDTSESGGLPPLAERLEQLYDTLSEINNHVDQLIDRVDI
jgi:DNA repair ATPase RecN